MNSLAAKYICQVCASIDSCWHEVINSVS